LELHQTSRLTQPVFAPKYLNTDLALAREFPVSASIFAANFGNERFNNLRQAVCDNSEILIVDPLTHAFSYRGFLDKPTFTGLPYAPDGPFDAGYFREVNRTRDFAVQVVDHELRLEADVLVPPYLYTRDLDDGRLRTNIRFVSETLRIRTERELENQVFAMICFSGTILESPVSVRDLIEQYREPGVDGYLLTVESFDDRQVSTEMLVGLARLMRGLAVDRDVMVCSIASFGQVLAALGANGFSAGVGWLETFREVNLQPGRINFPADRAHRSQFYYFPELLSYLSPDAAQDILGEGGSETARQFLCDCPACVGRVPANPPEKKQHFMHRRLREMVDLAGQTPENRPRFMRDRIGLALELAGAIEEERFVRVPTEHFGVRRKSDKQELWAEVVEGISPILGGKLQIEAAVSSPGGDHLAVSLETKSWLGLKTRQAGFLYAIHDRSPVGRVVLGKRETVGWVLEEVL
jgi:hypothetical protein